MVNCQKCDKEFKYPYLLKRHRMRKTDCSNSNRTQTHVANNLSTKEHNNKPEAPFKNTDITSIKTPINKGEIIKELKKTMNTIQKMYDDVTDKQKIGDKYENDHKNIECKYCKKTIVRRTINRHYREYCFHIPKYMRKKYIEKYNRDRRTIKNSNKIQKDDNDTKCNRDKKEIRKTKDKNTNKQYNSVDNSVTNANTNNTNNGTITNVSGSINNVINNNVIYVNPFGKENIELSEEETDKILNAKEKGYHETLKCIFNKTENRNFFASGNKYVCCLDNDGNLELQHKKDALYTISDTGEKAYNKILTDKDNKLTVREKKVNEIKADAIDEGEYENEHIRYSELILVEKSVANEKFLKSKFKTLDDKFLNELGKNYVLKIK